MAATPEPTLQLSGAPHTASSAMPSEEERPLSESTGNDAEPEPLSLADISTIRRRLAEMGFNAASAPPNATPRERELANMVMRLTESPLVDPSQLIHQAATISDLTSQRDYLIYQIEEQRQLWHSQRDHWQRMADALIAQRNKQLNSSSKDPELERKNSALESENRALRDKLHDTQHRLQALEAELAKLKPILLMQPFATAQSSLASIQHASSFLSSLPYPSSGGSAPSKQKSKRKKMEQREATQLVVRDDRESQATEPVQTNSQQELTSARSSFLQFQAAPAPSQQPPKFSGDHYRRPTTPAVGGPLTSPPTTLSFQLNPVVTEPLSTRVMQLQTPSSPAKQPPPPASSSFSQPQPGPSTSANMTKPTQTSARPSGTETSSRNGKAKATNSVAIHPLSADARSEHLLLAARKIGRERAGIVVGYLRSKQAGADIQHANGDKTQEKPPDKEPAATHTPPVSHYREPVNGLGAPLTPKQTIVAEKESNKPPSPDPDTTPISRPRPQSPEKRTGDEETHARHDPAPVAGPSTPRVLPRRSHVTRIEHLMSTPTNSFTSLLDAARMMGHERSSSLLDTESQINSPQPPTTNGQGRGRRRNAAAIEPSESPPHKRRKVNTTRTSSTTSAASVERPPVHHIDEVRQRDVPRVRSALDVLADQAAAFSSTSREPEPPRQPKGKEKDVAAPNSSNDVEDTPKDPPKAKKATKPKGKAKAASKAREKQPEPKPKRAPRAPPKDRSLTTTRLSLDESSTRSSSANSRIIKAAAPEPRMIAAPDPPTPSATRPVSLEPPVDNNSPKRTPPPAHSLIEAEKSLPSASTSPPGQTIAQSPATETLQDNPNGTDLSPSRDDHTATTLQSTQGPAKSPPPTLDRSLPTSDADNRNPLGTLGGKTDSLRGSHVPQGSTQTAQPPMNVTSLRSSAGFQNFFQSVAPGSTNGSPALKVNPSLPPFLPIAGVSVERSSAISPDAVQDEGVAEQGSLNPLSEVITRRRGPFVTETLLSPPHLPQASVPTSKNTGSRARNTMAVHLERDMRHEEVLLPRALSKEGRSVNPQREAKSGGHNEGPGVGGDVDAEGEEDAEGEVDSEVDDLAISPSVAHRPEWSTSEEVEGASVGRDPTDSSEARMSTPNNGQSATLP